MTEQQILKLKKGDFVLTVGTKKVPAKKLEFVRVDFVESVGEQRAICHPIQTASQKRLRQYRPMYMKKFDELERKVGR